MTFRGTMLSCKTCDFRTPYDETGVALMQEHQKTHEKKRKGKKR